MNTQKERLFSETFPFWEALPKADKEFLFENSYNVRYKKGVNIHDGNECTGLLMVTRGCLRVYMLSDEGKEITLYRLDAGDLCMLSASCVLHSITFDVFIDAEEDSECILIAGCAFSNLAERNPYVKIFMLDGVIGRFSEVMWVMQQILFMSLDRRLAIFLLDESAKTGSDTIKLTHEQIAKYMGSAREVVSRMMKYFVTEGIVEASRQNGIKIIDKKRLRAIAK